LRKEIFEKSLHWWETELKEQLPVAVKQAQFHRIQVKRFLEYLVAQSFPQLSKAAALHLRI